jgi:hypothetical protein
MQIGFLLFLRKILFGEIIPILLTFLLHLHGASVAMTTSATETDNAYFANGSTAQSSVTVSGTKSELLALFTDASKYYKNDAGALTIPTYTITVSTSPTLSATTLESFGNVAVGTTAGPKSFTLTGSNLTGNVTVGALTGFTYSTTETGTYANSLT